MLWSIRDHKFFHNNPVSDSVIRRVLPGLLRIDKADQPDLGAHYHWSRETSKHAGGSPPPTLCPYMIGPRLFV